MSSVQSFWARSKLIRSGVIAGSAAGLVIGGIGSRLIMRVVALVDESKRGRLTDSGATVGQFTLEGTLTLLLLCTIVGAFGGIAYLLLRRWIPSFAPRGITFGAGLFILPGMLVFNEANPDFQVFTPVLLFLSFSLLSFCYTG